MRTYIFSLDADRLGDEVVIEAESVEAARRLLTRTQRRKETSVREFIGTSRRREEAHAAGLPFPVPVKQARAHEAAMGR